MSNLSDALGLPDLTSNTLPEIFSIEENKEKTDQENDYKFARDNIYEIINKGLKTLDELKTLAFQSQNNKVYDSLSTMMKTLLDANKDLAEHSRKNDFLDKLEKDLGSDVKKHGIAPPTVTNNLFVGSTKDLQAVLKELNSKKE